MHRARPRQRGMRGESDVRVLTAAQLLRMVRGRRRVVVGVAVVLRWLVVGQRRVGRWLVGRVRIGHEGVGRGRREGWEGVWVVRGCGDCEAEWSSVRVVGRR